MTKANAMTTIPGNPNSSAKPVFGRAVEVGGTVLSAARAACVYAAPMVAV